MHDLAVPYPIWLVHFRPLMDGNTNSNREKLLKALEYSDLNTRNARMDRIEWLSLHRPIVPVVLGRVETLQLLEEAQQSFISGHFVATLIVAMAFVEHCLIEELQILGLIKGSPSFSTALTVASDEKIFPHDWLVRAKVLSLRRNPFAHLKPEGHGDTLGARIYDEKLHPRAIMEADAKDAIDLMCKFFVATAREADLENLANTA